MNRNEYAQCHKYDMTCYVYFPHEKGQTHVLSPWESPLKNN